MAKGSNNLSQLSLRVETPHDFAELKPPPPHGWETGAGRVPSDRDPGYARRNRQS